MRKRLTALLLSFVMLLTMLPVTVSAEGAEETGGGTATGHVLDISHGDITITNDGFTYYVADDADATQVQEKTYNWVGGEEHKVTITGSTGNDVKATAKKNNQIIIKSGNPEVTLGGVIIKAYKHDGNDLRPQNGSLNSRPGVWLQSGSATLVLQGDNVVQGSYFRPGVLVNNGTTLTIEGDGTLTTRGGGQHAGIGGQGGNGMGTVIVKGGTLNFPDDPNAGGYGMTTAFGGQNKGSKSDVLCGTIMVEGGIVNIPKGDVTADTFIMSGGILTASKGLVASKISVTGGTLNAAVNTERVDNISVTGGNINSSYAGTIENYALTKLYFYNEDGTRMAETAVTVDGWTAMTDANGVITTYLENDKTTITYNNVSYNVVDHAVLIGVAQEASALQWAAGDPPTITIDSDTTGVVSGKLDGTVKVTRGTADLTMKQEGANEWTVVAEEAADSVVLRLDTVNGKVRFGNSGDAQYQMGYVTADKVKLNPDGGNVAVNADGSVTWGKYTLTGIGSREIVVNGADTEAERTVANSGDKAITVNGETLAAGESMTIRKAERCQTAEDGDATASYVLGGGHTINEFSSSVEEFKPKTRVFSHMTLEEYRALMRLSEVEEEEINALIQVGTISGYRALVVGEGCTASLPYIKDEAGAVSDMQRLITEAFLDEDITAQGKKDRSLYNSHLISLDILHLQTVELYNLDIVDLYIGAQVTYFGRGYLRVTGSITVDPNSDSYKAEDSILFTKDGATLLYFPNTKTGSYTTPSTCVEIGTQAFNESHLSEITLGANLKTLGKSWNEGSRIKAINVSASNLYFTSDNGVLYNENGTNLVLYPRFREGAEYEIPEGVTSVDTMGVYQNKCLKKITLASSVVKGGNYLLGLCDMLEELDVRTLHITGGDISSQMLSKVTVPEGYNFAKRGLLVKCASWPTYKYLPMTWTNTLSAPKDVSVPYDGQPHSITVSSTDDTVTIQYSLDGKTWSDSVECIEPGEYTIYWKAIKPAEAEETSEDSKTDGIYGFDREVNSSVTLTITGLPVEKTWFTLEPVRMEGDAGINTTEPVTFTLPEGNIAIDGSCVTYTYNGKIELPTAAGSYLVKVAVKGATGYADTEFELGYYTILGTDNNSKIVMSFVTNGGTTIEPIIEGAGRTITAPAAPTREGYTFEGWYGDVTLKTKVETIPTSMLDSNITYYAKWTPVEYTITYNGVEGANPVSNPATYTIETPDFTLINPTKPGYAFKGWQVGDNESAVAQTVEIQKGSIGNRTFTAIFEQETYAITYVECAEGAKTYKMGDAVTLSVPADRKGYTFMGWTLNIDGRTMVQDKSETTLPTHLYGDMTVTGIWLANDQTLTFHANGGTFSAKFGGKETYAVTAKTDSKFKLPDAPTRPGYTFQGWFMEANGTTAFDAAVMPSADTTIYAKWAVDAQLTTAPEGVTVDGLDKVAQAKAAEIRMSIEATGADGDAQRAISTKAGSRVQLSFYEMTVLADGSPLSDIGTVIAIKIPFQTAGRTITVYRYHGSEAQTLTKLDAVPAAPVDGTYFVGDGYVMIYSSQFSTYAIGYTETASSGGRRHYTGTPGAEITGGADQTKRAGDIIKVTAKSDGAKVSAVYVDGAMVDGKYYIVSGNAVKLQGTYTATLSQGTHTLRVVYTNGAAVTTTFVLKGTTSPHTGDPGVGIYLASVVLSIAGSAYVFRKKKSDD